MYISQKHLLNLCVLSVYESRSRCVKQHISKAIPAVHPPVEAESSPCLIMVPEAGVPSYQLLEGVHLLLTH